MPDAGLTTPSGSWPAADVYAETLSGLFPDWRIWSDRGGWHARRRGGYLQRQDPGAPSYYVHADTAAGLAVQLCLQAAADQARSGGLPPADTGQSGT